MNKLRTIILTLMLIFTFSTLTFAQAEKPTANEPNLKEWSVESYQSWDYTKSDNFRTNDFHFNGAYVWYTTSLKNFDLQASLHAYNDTTIKKYDVNLYTANLSYSNKLSSNLNYNIMFGKYENAWYVYTQNLLGNINRTFDVPLIQKYSAKNGFTDFYYTDLNKEGIEAGINNTKDWPWELYASFNTGVDNTKNLLVAGSITPLSDLNVGIMYNTKTCNDLENTWYTFGGAVDLTHSFKKAGKIKVGGEFLYNKNLDTNSYVTTAYVGYTPKKLSDWTLLLKGDYYLPKTTEGIWKYYSTEANLIWTPSQYVNIGFQYIYNWDRTVDTKNVGSYTLGIKTGFIF
jgi:hypothetical protein